MGLAGEHCKQQIMCSSLATDMPDERVRPDEPVSTSEHGAISSEHVLGDDAVHVSPMPAGTTDLKVVRRWSETGISGRTGKMRQNATELVRRIASSTATSKPMSSNGLQ